MKSVIRISNYWSRLLNIRHSHGFGLQSPFAYNLEREVINQGIPYYAYKSLSDNRKAFSQQDLVNSGRIDTLLFRLANYMQPAVVMTPHIGWALSVQYLKAGCEKAKIVTYSNVNQLLLSMEGIERTDFLCVDILSLQPMYPKILTKMNERSLVVVSGINREKKAWVELVNAQTFGVSFNLGKLGLIFIDKRLTPENHIVYFPD